MALLVPSSYPAVCRRLSNCSNIFNFVSVHSNSNGKFICFHKIHENNLSSSSVVGCQLRPDVPELRPSPQRDTCSVYSMKEKGIVYDKKPFKFLCKKGRRYNWCSCGRGHTQPFCDGTHKSPFVKIVNRPMLFIPEETREYWFCNCKQTKNPPFCDGSHRKPQVQDARSIVRNL